MLNENLLFIGNYYEPMGIELRLEDLIVKKPAKNKKNQQVILKGISCVIPKNSLTAIVGSFGSGKTTLINLLSS